MKTVTGRSLFVWVTMALAVWGAQGAVGAVINKANNTDSLNLTTSWIGGVVPGSGDIGQWDSNTVANTVSLGANLNWLGLSLDSTHSGNVSISSGNTLTLGASGVSMPGTGPTLTFNCSVVMSTAQTWTANAILSPIGTVDTAGYTLTLAGTGTKQTKNLVSGNGEIIITGGSLKMSNGSKAPGSTLTAIAAGINYETSTGVANSNRSVNINMSGGSFTINCTSGDAIDTNANAFTVSSGAGISTINLNQPYARSGGFYSGSLVRNAGSLLWFKGLNFGIYPWGSKTTYSVNMLVGTPPALVGAGGGANTTTCSIFVGGYLDTNNAPANAATAYFATYDSTYGFRPLNVSTELKSTITDGQSQLDNVRLINTSGAVVTNTISSPTTINALALHAGTTGSGIILNGAGTLTLNSGMILAGDTNAANVTNSLILTNLTLNLNGREGVVVFANAGTVGATATAGGILEIDGKITNDGGNGLTVGGSGVLKFGGSIASDYTGNTMAVAGNTVLAKSGVNAIAGNLLVMGTGTTVYDTGDQIADTSDISVSTGANFTQQTGGSGNCVNEKFRDLVMTGGNYWCGRDTSSGAFYLTNRNATLSGGAFNLARPMRVTMAGQLTLSGGTIAMARANETTGYSTSLTVSNGVVITNTTSSAYTPITLANAGTGQSGGKVVLAGDLTFVGNSNTNTVTILANAPTSTGLWGAMALAGNRTFTIGDGAASNDLTLSLPVVDDSSGAGGLIKAGAGTLALNGTNTYTGATSVNNGSLVVNAWLGSAATVNSNGTLLVNGVMTNTATVNSNGVLIVNGMVSNSVTINNSGVLTGTGVVSRSGTSVTVNEGGVIDPGSVGGMGTLTVTGSVVFAAGGKLRVDANGASSDLLAVTGTVSAASTVSVTVNAVGDGPWKVMSAGSITASFTSTDPDIVFNTMSGGTELWMYRGVRGTTLIIQ